MARDPWWFHSIGAIIPVVLVLWVGLNFGCIKPRDGISLGYDLDEVGLLRYSCVSRSPGTTYPVNTWEILLEIAPAGRGQYTVTRTSTNFPLGGFNSTFNLGEMGDLSGATLDKYSTSYEEPPGEWVTVAVQGDICGRGYYQEIPPLPGKTVGEGDSWNGTFGHNTSSQTRGESIDFHIVSPLTGYVVCTFTGRKKIETVAGEFEVIEVESSGETTTEVYRVFENGTVEKSPRVLTLPYQRTYMIDQETGVVVSSSKFWEDDEAPYQRHEIIAELVEIQRVGTTRT